jgi:predicted RNA-binding protein associated with RNAse of E/G family
VSAERRARIHYRRLPEDERIFDQRILLERDDVMVTISEPLTLDEPVCIEGAIALETGSRALWFTFPGCWHDIGRFHRADGTFTGIYANILTPPRMEGADWYTTDLFLDLWLPEHGAVKLLDEDELAEALTRGHIDAELAGEARAEASRLLELAGRGAWPPAVVREWTLQRAMATADD